MKDSSVRLVCFDLGRVLVRLARGWDDACARAGVHLGEGGPAAWRRHQGLLLRYECGEMDESGYLRDVCQCLPGVPPSDVTKIFDAWLLGMYPWAAELNANGTRTACLSNTNDRHWRTVIRGDPAYAPLARLGSHFASHQIGVMKPDARAYRHVETQTGLGGGSILFFDDREENAAAAGR